MRSSPGTRAARPSRPVTFATVRRLALALPGVEECTSYGTAAFKVRGKFLTRLKEDGASIVLILGTMTERDFLLGADPAVFFITPHYRDYPDVLVRLAAVKPALLAELLENAWRRLAPKRLVAEFDAARAARRPLRPRR